MISPGLLYFLLLFAGVCVTIKRRITCRHTAADRRIYMIELGKKQELLVVKSVEFGVYLGEKADADAKNRVLLPAKQVPENTREGDRLEVFIYKDSKDRLIATTREPAATVGETALLTVRQVTKIGAFLDWGLEKDLLLPYHEQTVRVREGQECLVALYVDKSSRLCATMKVYPYLRSDSPYQKGDQVRGRVYQISDNFGVFVAVDDKYSALIPARETAGKYRPGEILDLRVTEVKEDGKLNVTNRQKAYLQIDEDAENVLQVIEEFAGVLPFDDKAAPEVIRREFGLSKNAFKRAVGPSSERGKDRDPRAEDLSERRIIYRRFPAGAGECHRQKEWIYEFYTPSCSYRIQSAGRIQQNIGVCGQSEGTGYGQRGDHRPWSDVRGDRLLPRPQRRPGSILSWAARFTLLPVPGLTERREAGRTAIIISSFWRRMIRDTAT